MLACRKLHGAGLVPTGEDLLAVRAPPAPPQPSLLEPDTECLAIL